MIRVSPKGYFITKNYAITDGEEFIVLLSAGGRSIIRNIGLGYSLWIPLIEDIDTFIAIPFLGNTVPPGRKN